MAIDHTFTDLVKQLIREQLATQGQASEPPDLISMDEAAQICGCDRHTLMAIVHNGAARFPAIKLGPRTYRVDRRRLYRWLESGGLLSYGEHNETQ